MTERFLDARPIKAILLLERMRMAIAGSVLVRLTAKDGRWNVNNWYKICTARIACALTCQLGSDRSKCPLR